jgi:hypothetical protein
LHLESEVLLPGVLERIELLDDLLEWGEGYHVEGGKDGDALDGDVGDGVEAALEFEDFPAEQLLPLEDLRSRIQQQVQSQVLLWFGKGSPVLHFGKIINYYY